jgi:hypothetical protein
MADTKVPHGLTLSTAAPIDGSTIVRATPTPGEQALRLPASPALSATVFVQNESVTGTAALVFPGDPGVHIDTLAPGSPKSISVGAALTFTCTSGFPYSWTTA